MCFSAQTQIKLVTVLGTVMSLTFGPVVIISSLNIVTGVSWASDSPVLAHMAMQTPQASRRNEGATLWRFILPIQAKEQAKVPGVSIYV